MRAIYGVGNISPLIMDAYLSKYESRERVRLKKRIIDSNKANIKYDVDVLFAMSFKSITANLKSINNSNAVVFVFDSPLLLSGAGVDVVDAVVNSSVTKHKFTNFTEKSFNSLLKRALTLQSNEFIPAKLNSSSSYLLNRKSESITQILLTITLSEPDENKRRITTIIVKWLMNKNRNINSLLESMESLISVDSFIILGKFLESDTCKNTVAVFDSIRPEMRDKEIKSLCKKKGVPSFDVLFLLSQINSNRRGK